LHLRRLLPAADGRSQQIAGARSMKLGELEIIARYFARRQTRSDVLLGIGDDAAVLQMPAERRLVVAMDTIVEGVHFPSGTNAADIGYRALAVNLSDLAAMGAQPSWMTLSLSLSDADDGWLDAFAAGLFDLADRHDVALVGGDTTRGPLVVTVQVAGYVEADGWLRRSGAQPGDLLFVSGMPGEAAAGLAVIQQGVTTGTAAAHLRNRFLRPDPRIALGRHLRLFATAAMDVSDGLLTDLDKLCDASHCGSHLDINLLPQSAAMRSVFGDQACVDYALAGGDDYELLFTVAPAQVRELAHAPVTCTRIGVITDGSGVQCFRKGQPVSVGHRGYEHFAAKESP
jgi:thiamine-monophosphate kinase